MAGIRVENVTRRFGKVRALDDVSIEVRDQEFVVLLGPSGCGKTTLLRIIAGLESADSGRVLIGDRDVTNLAPRNRGIAMVFQNYAIFPHLTVYENIAFGLRMARASQALVKERVDKAASLMHIEALLERHPAQLSGGQRQRVAVARALAVEPQVLLMDEPLSNLDALLRLEMRAELKRLLHDAQTTTLYVTHDQVEAMSLADRIAVMDAGQIAQYDSPVRVYQDPANTFVGGFIGNPPMNFLKVHRGGTPAPTSDGDVLLGVRPEDLDVLTAPADGAFAADVLVVEHLGPHLLLTLDSGGQTIKAHAAPDRQIIAGERVYLRPNLARSRWLDAGTGMAVSAQ